MDPEITLTELDVRRLTPILKVYEAGHEAEVVRQLRAKIGSSPAIPAEKVPPDLVTMNCLVVYEDERTRERREIVLTYPDRDEPARGRVSILWPTSASLLGTRVGQSVECTSSSGKKTRIKVLEIRYQPEKEGHLHL